MEIPKTIVDSYERPTDAQICARLELECGGSWSVEHGEGEHGWEMRYLARFDRHGGRRRGHWRYAVVLYITPWGAEDDRLAVGWWCRAGQYPSACAPAGVQGGGFGRTPQEALAAAEQAVHRHRAERPQAIKAREKLEQAWREAERAEERRAELAAGPVEEAPARPVARATQLDLLGGGP